MCWNRLPSYDAVIRRRSLLSLLNIDSSGTPATVAASDHHRQPYNSGDNSKYSNLITSTDALSWTPAGRNRLLQKAIIWRRSALMSGRRWDGGGGGRGIESEEEEAGVGLMSGVHVAIHRPDDEEEEESSFGGRGITAGYGSGGGGGPGGCGTGTGGGGSGGGCAGPSSSSSSACFANNRTSGAKHVLVWNQPELDELTAADGHNGYSHRPVPAKGIYPLIFSSRSFVDKRTHVWL